MMEHPLNKPNGLLRTAGRIKRGMVLMLMIALACLLGWILASIPLLLCDELLGTRLFPVSGNGILPGFVVSTYLLGDRNILRIVGRLSVIKDDE